MPNQPVYEIVVYEPFTKVFHGELGFTMEQVEDVVNSADISQKAPMSDTSKSDEGIALFGKSVTLENDARYFRLAHGDLHGTKFVIRAIWNIPLTLLGNIVPSNLLGALSTFANETGVPIRIAGQSPQKYTYQATVPWDGNTDPAHQIGLDGPLDSSIHAIAIFKPVSRNAIRIALGYAISLRLYGRMQPGEQSYGQAGTGQAPEIQSIKHSDDVGSYEINGLILPFVSISQLVCNQGTFVWRMRNPKPGTEPPPILLFEAIFRGYKLRLWIEQGIVYLQRNEHLTGQALPKEATSFEIGVQWWTAGLLVGVRADNAELPTGRATEHPRELVPPSVELWVRRHTLAPIESYDSPQHFFNRLLDGLRQLDWGIHKSAAQG